MMIMRIHMYHTIKHSLPQVKMWKFPYLPMPNYGKGLIMFKGKNLAKNFPILINSHFIDFKIRKCINYVLTALKALFFPNLFVTDFFKLKKPMKRTLPRSPFFTAAKRVCVDFLLFPQLRVQTGSMGNHAAVFHG